jgi:hypothetical protein
LTIFTEKLRARRGRLEQAAGQKVALLQSLYGKKTLDTKFVVHLARARYTTQWHRSAGGREDVGK